MIADSEKETFLFLKKSISDRITSVNRNRLYYRRRSFYAFISTTILAALTTVLLGINSVDPDCKEFIRIAALLISSVITIVNAYNSYFNHKELWLINNQALNRFYKLQFEIEFLEKGHENITPDKINELREEYQKIIDQLNSEWDRHRATSYTKPSDKSDS
ncbi:DUF4231 domain-containing protein [Cytophagaceae bacterium YF14B1]|uniref:DUF4231 domain-containing protein n=1 Tax=Xanthocytophaga flava TaxID=3048013 RepID=A0AAE3QTV2_9BACT|nr:DUF4231 domain-containing protein [Xanthocytophaga flavus]MDJ1483115.1 DUF4231 domain-containing protein [Xanthocytophaga flavus]